MILHGDCLEQLKKLEPNSVDMVLADLPYGTTACKWDTVIPFGPLWAELKRVTKPNAALCFFGSEPFYSRLLMSGVQHFRHEWIWQKNCGSNFANLKTAPFKEHEKVAVFSVRAPRFYPIRQERSEAGKAMVRSRKYKSRTGGDFIGGALSVDTAKRDPDTRHPSSVQKFKREVGLHPTQKPVALLEYLIRTYTNEGDTVLDPTMGSGSTGVAALKCGRKFIGIEREAEYVEISRKRLEAVG